MCVCVFVSSSGRYVLELLALFYRMPLEFICLLYKTILIMVHHNNVYMYYVYAVCVTWHMMCISICVSICVCVCVNNCCFSPACVSVCVCVCVFMYT